LFCPLCLLTYKKLIFDASYFRNSMKAFTFVLGILLSSYNKILSDELFSTNSVFHVILNNDLCRSAWKLCKLLTRDFYRFCCCQELASAFFGSIAVTWSVFSRLLFLDSLDCRQWKMMDKISKTVHFSMKLCKKFHFVLKWKLLKGFLMTPILKIRSLKR